MSLRINTNPAAINTHRVLSQTSTNMSKSLEKLSSGLRINRASDDAAGLSISESLRAQVSGLAMANRNAQDGISMINTAEGALNETTAILQRMRELAVQNANGTMTTSDRIASGNEFTQLTSELDNIASYSKFNGMDLLSAANNTFTFQVGANLSETQVVNTVSMTSGALGIVSTVGITTQSVSSAAISALDVALAKVSSLRAVLGAATNRLEHVVNNTAVSKENLAAAESRIRDTDMAAEMTNLTRQQILMQSGTAMLSQANQMPQGVLSLLR